NAPVKRETGEQNCTGNSENFRNSTNSSKIIGAVRLTAVTGRDGVVVDEIVPESFRLIERSRASEVKSEQSHAQPNSELAIKNRPPKALAFRGEEMRDKKRDSDCQAVVFGCGCDADQKSSNCVIPRGGS